MSAILNSQRELHTTWWNKRTSSTLKLNPNFHPPVLQHSNGTPNCISHKNSLHTSWHVLGGFLAQKNIIKVEIIHFEFSSILNPSTFPLKLQISTNKKRWNFRTCQEAGHFPHRLNCPLRQSPVVEMRPTSRAVFCCAMVLVDSGPLVSHRDTKTHLLSAPEKGPGAKD